MRLPWTRTVLVTLAFVWVMLAWYQHVGLDKRERAHVEELISRYCSLEREATGEFRPATERERDECEIGLRSTGLGSRGFQVGGSVDVSGNVSVAP